MSKLPRPPKYCRQRRKGRPNRAYVKIDGKRVYLGDYGTPESRRKYREAIAVMEESGKPETAKPAPTEPTLSVLLAGYLEFAVKKYGEKSIELWHLKAVAKLLHRTHGSTLARHFGPKAYQEARRAMIEEDWSRRYIGDQCSRIKRIVGWGVTEELLPGDAKHRLDAVRGLTAGEFGRVKPIRLNPSIKQPSTPRLPSCRTKWRISCGYCCGRECGPASWCNYLPTTSIAQATCGCIVHQPTRRSRRGSVAKSPSAPRRKPCWRSISSASDALPTRSRPFAKR